MKKTAKEWLEKAESDLDDAQFAINGDRKQLGAFLLQQSVEKALKSLHIEFKESFDKTHNLVKLASEFNIPEQFDEMLVELTTVYTGFRYPDISS